MLSYDCNSCIIRTYPGGDPMQHLRDFNGVCSCVTCETVLCLGCDHLKHHPDMCEIVETFVHGSHSVLPCITLFMKKKAKFNKYSWEQFFQIFHKLKSLPDMSRDEHDLNLTALLSSMKTFSGLKVVHLALSSVTVQCASSILHFFQTCPFLKQIYVKCSAVSEKNSCICASCTKLQCFGCEHSRQYYSLHEVVGGGELNHVSNPSAQNRTHADSHENFYIDLGVTRNSKNEFKLSLRCDGDTKPVIAFILLIVTDFSDITTISWESFFQSYYDTHELTESVLEEDKSEGDSTCSAFTVKRNFTHNTVSVKVTSLEESSTPSEIFFTIHYSGIQRLDGAGLLNKMKLLNELTETSQTYTERVMDLISLLRSVTGLLKLKLEIKTLTLSWATWILSFKACQQLKKINVITQNPLMEEVLISLKKSWTCENCSLVVKGVDNDHRHQRIKITFPGAHLKESLYYSDSDSEDNAYNNDYKRFKC